MIRLIDYRCPRCLATYKDVTCDVPINAMDMDLKYYCGECEKAGERVPCYRVQTAPAFTIGGFNAKNGYSK